MKLLLKIFIGVIVLMFVTIALLMVFVDPNNYKSEIEAQVKSNLNRDLHINGDIGWTLYPQLGFSSGEIQLDNLAGFSRPHLLKINEASLGINILPLLKGEISIGKLTLNGFEVTLLTDKQGVSNLDNMGAEKSSETQVTTETETTNDEGDAPFFAFNKTQLEGIDVNNAIIEVEDLQANSYQKITINEIKLGEFAFDKETDFAINTKLIIDDMQADIQLSSLILVNEALSNVQVKALQVDTLVTANALPNGQLKSTLKTDVDFAVNENKVTLNGLDINTQIEADNLPNKKVSTQFNAAITYLLDSQLASINNLKLKVDDIELAGEASVQTGNITKVRYQLETNTLDLNNYITKTEDSNESDPAPTSTETAEEVEPDLSFLNTLDIDGQLNIAGVKVDNIEIGQIKKHLIIKSGKAQIKPLTVELYEGLLTLNSEVSDSKGANAYNVSTSLKDVQIRPLLTDVAELDILSGTTNFNFSGQGQGLTATKIKQGLVGKGDFELLDGELYGVNINQEIRILKAKITGQTLPTSDSIKKTDFASLTGGFTIDKGLVNNQKLLMLSPVMRLDGSGLVQIINETLDYKLSISPLSKSTEETDYVDLNGVTIPMLIKGSFTDPKISLDTESALQGQLKAKADALKAEAKEKVEAELEKQKEKIGSKVEEKLGSELGGKLKSLF
ncbi:AsmA family protein [Psychromonas sp. KJ10-10]|uniref:AsmA family protein n=1 Tax=Psychromonas sp. KJ10-10 TaxID=3391823 RepID=UPI0039B4A92E